MFSRPFLALLLSLPGLTHAAEPDAPPPPVASVDASADLAQAIETFERFLAEHPEGPYSTSARFRLAGLLVNQAEAAGSPPAYGPAIQQLERVVADVQAGQAGDFEAQAEAWYLLGWCQRELGPTRAAEAWQRVATLAPGSALATASALHLGGAAMDAGAWEEAVRWFELARQAPDQPETWAQASYMAAWAHYKLDHWDPAASGFAAVLGSDDPAAATLHEESLAYLVLVLIERCEAEGLAIDTQLDAALAGIPAARRVDFLTRTAEVLESAARFDEAAWVRDQATRGTRETPHRKRRDR